MLVKISDWAWLPLKDYPPHLLGKLKERLTISPRRTSKHQEEILPIELYRQRHDSIGIPRTFFLKNKKPTHQIIDEMSYGRPIDVKFNGTLKDDQQEAVDKIVKCFASDELNDSSTGGIIRAVPGYGKTVVAIKIWTELARTGIVIVHKKFLVDQWRDRIKTFAPDARVGIIQQDRCEFGDDYDISIAMIQSLVKRQREYPKELWSWPSVVCSDEVHRVGSKFWSKVVPFFTGRHRIGLSATPRRKDRADDVFFFHIGDVLYNSKTRKVVPKIRRVFTKFELYRTPRFNPNKASKEIQLRFLCSNPDRNRLIIGELLKATEKGRTVLVLSERRKHLELLSGMFGEVKSKECVSDFYVGGRLAKELEIAGKANVIFATYMMAKEALDLPQLDTLFLVTPIMDVEQPVGRIMREYPDKKQPIVVDFIDSKVKRFEGLFKARLYFYQKNGMI